ncbi:MAG TPA: hypothetical protein PKL83_02940 [bacterium]|nr:hypothetical protein [bacterium]
MYKIIAAFMISSTLFMGCTGCTARSEKVSDQIQDPLIESRDAARKADLASVRTALAEYYAAYGAYPLAASYEDLSRFLVPNYIRVFPSDPGDGAYEYNGSESSYTLSATLEEDGSTYTVSSR